MTSSADARIGRRCVLGLAASASIIPGLAQAGSGGSEAPLRFGLTPVFLTSDLELLARLQLYLEHRTGLPVILVTRRTYQEITTLLTSGQLDAAWICGYPFVAHRAELRLVAVPLWRAAPLYQSYVIVDRDRTTRDFADLRGDIHACSDPDSNSGFLSTIALLARQGMRPDGFFARSFFTYGHRNVIRAVASGLASSGSVDGYVYEVVAELEPALTARTRVLHRSEWLGFPPIAAPRVPVDERRLSSLTKALLEMNGVPEGQAVLRLLRLDGFAAGEPALFDTIAANVALVAQAG
ncbi:MAG TPA: PhnD/SsuA/transferrin family substrate-binding protein [Geminicoccus sp.]|jgi:phosphonate transport system substrate-binding protein|uniref:substrate-binding domain-containing protein n=1 Tax=Geminicoccus sp. TaxID=2024832 RepID=UPI002E3387B5|nr:PhnD/SsuA/transferrin family substrate-binding protein [Geminicoccus sp.]HEX2528665.1 PhnD/SsuA/transferrin family substrate-binding protein [Geminicoccus sp.]